MFARRCSRPPVPIARTREGLELRSGRRPCLGQPGDRCGLKWTWGAQRANYGLPGNPDRGELSIDTEIVAQVATRPALTWPRPKPNACEVLRKRTVALGTDDWYAREMYFPSNRHDPSAWGMGVGQYNFSDLGRGARGRHRTWNASS
jgi:hypothetical protein